MKKIFHNGKQLRAGWRLCIFCVLLFVFYFILRRVAEHLSLPEGLHPVSLIVFDAGMLAVALLATAIMARFEHRSLAVYGIPRWRDLFGRMFWKGAIWGLAMPAGVIFMMVLAGGYRAHGLNLTGSALLKFGVLWLVANLFIGFSEEILFRGYFLYTLADGIGFWVAAIPNAIGFGALHYFTKPDERWEDWVAVTLITLFITLALRRTGSLAFPIGMHFAFDFQNLYVFSGMNGGLFATGRLLKAEFPGPNWVTGGLLGPEASWFTFAATIAAIALLNFIYREAKWPLPEN
ncbi:MAG: type II CAAX endopeptidase family protein [Candidatus Sulfotelmatobacter sp.]